MLYGLYASAAGAMASSYRQDVIANNLANADTVAFKRDLALTMSRRTEAQQNGSGRSSNAMLENLGGGTFSWPTYTDFSPAALEHTDNPFDVALSGDGFFQVQNGSQINYTRDGRFMLDQQHRLVTVSGNLPVLNEASAPIVLDADQAFAIDQAGAVSQAGSIVAQLGVVGFDDTKGLHKQGENLYVTATAAQPKPIATTVKQGFLESSGVDEMRQLVDMIKSQRLFQANISMLQLQDQTLGYATTRLGSIT